MRWATLGFLGILGCSGSSFEVGASDAAGDSAVLDGTALDSSSIDSGDTSDSGTAADTGLLDTGGKDTGVLDTGVVDTGVVDTGVLDTGSLDTGPLDTGLLDTGLDTGDGAVCPRPKSTVTIDVSTLTCDDLKLKYPTTLPEARKCVCDADCSVTVGKDFCGCSVNASPANDAYVSVTQMQKRWTALGCMAFCPGLPCVEPPVAKCIFDVVGGAGRCN